MKKLYLLTFFTILTFSFLVATYGVFQSTTSRDALLDIAAFKVYVNETIVTSESKSFSIDDINWESVLGVAPGKVAPGMKGSFLIAIDPSDSEVSIRYDITYDMSFLENINSSIIVDSLEEVNGYELVRTGKYTYTGIIGLDEIKSKKTHIIKVNVKWLDNNDLNDYITGTTVSSIEIPIDVLVSQYLNEEIVVYVGEN